MFSVDDATTAAIRTAFDDSGELGAVVEFRRHFPLIDDNEHARRCVQMIVGWKPVEAPISRRLKRARRPKSLPS